MSNSLVFDEHTFILLLPCLSVYTCDSKPGSVGLLDTLCSHEDHLKFNWWRHFVGWFVIAVGAVYTALGCLCFRQLKSMAVTKIKRQKVMREEVHHLTAQKMEIERLLADTESKLEDL